MVRLCLLLPFWLGRVGPGRYRRLCCSVSCCATFVAFDAFLPALIPLCILRLHITSLPPPPLPLPPFLPPRHLITFRPPSAWVSFLLSPSLPYVTTSFLVPLYTSLASSHPVTHPPILPMSSCFRQWAHTSPPRFQRVDSSLSPPRAPHATPHPGLRRGARGRGT